MASSDFWDADPEQPGNGQHETHTAASEAAALPMVAPPQPLQRVQTPYVTAMAVQKPRELRRTEKALLTEAALMGEDAYYGWGTGRDRVEGPSVQLAYAALRAWGNSALAQEPLESSPEEWVFTVSFIDLESGITLPRKFSQSKRWTVHGRFDEERKRDMRFQIGQSKAIRNAILAAIPRWLIDRAMDKAKDGVRKRITGYIEKNSIEAARQMLIEGLKKLGVSVERVLAKVSRPAVGGLTVDDLVLLQGDLRALQTGADSAEAVFPPLAQPEQPAAGSATQQLKDKLKKSQGPRSAEPAPAPDAVPPAGAGTQPQPQGASPLTLTPEREPGED